MQLLVVSLLTNLWTVILAPTVHSRLAHGLAHTRSGRALGQFRKRLEHLTSLIRLIW